MRTSFAWKACGALALALLGCSGANPYGLIGPGDDGGASDATDSGRLPPIGEGGPVEAAPPPGDGSPPQASLAPASIDFGQSDCGGGAPSATVITLSNGGGSPFTWSASIDSSAFDVAGPSQGTVQAGGAAELQIAAKAVPASAAAGAVVTGKLSVMTSDAAHASFVVPLSIAARGATLSIVPVTAAFGQLPLNVQAPDIPLAITNSGNAAATLTFGAPQDSDFAVVWSGSPAPLAVAAGNSASAMARFRPTSTMSANVSTSIVVSGAALCGASATSLALTGQGVAGVVGVSPASIDFGMVSCGAQAAAKSITLYNTGSAPYSWTTALAKGGASPYTLSPSSGIVAASSQALVQVVPTTIPQTSSTQPDGYADTLTLTTDVVGDAPHVIPLHETAQGAVLALSAGTIAFGAQAMGSTGTQALTVTNTGNAIANIAVSVTGPGFGVSPSGNRPVVVGGMLALSATFSPSAPGALGARSGSIGVSTSDPLCGPLAGTVALSGSASDTAVFVTAGELFHTCAVGGSGYVYCWGSNSSGQLGNGLLTDSAAPYTVSGFTHATALSLGLDFTCAVASGSVSCWGANAYGQLGNASNVASSTPVHVTGLGSATAVSAGSEHACALVGGSVACWGDNSVGQLGNGTLNGSNVPVAVPGISGVVSVSAGFNHTCIVLSAGSVYCWGDNTYGQLGSGATGTNSPTPVAVPGIADAVAVAGGLQHTCAVRSGGGAFCWGDNTDGELGNGTNVSSTTPVSVSALSTATSITSNGNTQTCALLQGGGVACWGSGAAYELGNGSAVSSNVPVTPVGLSSATSVSAGAYYSCALKSSGSVMCWGTDNNGDLGDGQPFSVEAVPAAVPGL